LHKGANACVAIVTHGSSRPAVDVDLADVASSEGGLVLLVMVDPANDTLLLVVAVMVASGG
jgi:hypothetical protein